jgi:hypothetical protein
MIIKKGTGKMKSAQDILGQLREDLGIFNNNNHFNNKFLRMFHGSVYTLYAKRHAPCAFPLAAGGKNILNS